MRAIVNFCETKQSVCGFTARTGRPDVHSDGAGQYEEAQKFQYKSSI
jgi:hypothetical protein